MADPRSSAQHDPARRRPPNSSAGPLGDAAGIAPIHPHADPFDRGLWRLMYFAFWLCASLMAGLMLLPRDPTRLGGLQWIGWTLALALISAAACGYRLAIHEAMVDLQLRERVFLGLAVLIVTLAPAVVESAHIIPDGLLWATPLLIFLAPSPAIARRLLAWLLLGGWLAAFHVRGLPLYLLLGVFAVSWLFAVGAVHFTFIGEGSGLSARWAARRVLRNALAVSLPALAVALLVYWIWPGQGLNLLGPLWSPPEGAPQSEAVYHRIDSIQLLRLIWHGAVALVLTVLFFVVLLYLRRLFLGRRRGEAPSELLPGQTARMTFAQNIPEESRPSLTGRRGVLVRLWGRWAVALKNEGFGRQRGETARRFAERLVREHPEAAPPTSMTGLFEKAHYGQTEPSADDEETMRILVAEELSRQSLRMQTSAESLDDIE